MKDPIKNRQLIRELWNESVVDVEEFERQFNNVNVHGSAKSEHLSYWN